MVIATSRENDADPPGQTVTQAQDRAAKPTMAVIMGGNLDNPGDLRGLHVGGVRDPALYQVVRTSHQISLNTQEAFLLLDLPRLAVRQGIRLLCPFRGPLPPVAQTPAPQASSLEGEGRQGSR